MKDWTIIKVLSWTTSYLKKHSLESPRLTGEILLAHCLGIKRIDLYLQYDRPLHKNELSAFKLLIKRRIQNEPVAYITGEKGFFESDFEVSQDVLIPRPDTETLVEQALKILKTDKDLSRPRMILELGTGSGAIIVSLARAIPNNLYFASDISFAAIAIAKRNAKKIAKDRIRFYAGSWFSPLGENSRFDLVVSNPPYIPTADIQGLEFEIKEFEPMLALDGGTDGMDSYRSILKNAHNYLVPGGIILLEIGFDQKEIIQSICGQYKEYEFIDFIKDLSGHNRVALIKKID